MPPQKPCTTRNPISMGTLDDSAQPKLAKVNARVALTNIQRSDKARVRKPLSGIAITSAIR